MAYVPFLAGQKLTAQLANTRIVEEVMAWTALDDIGNFASGFAAHGSLPPQMRILRVMGTEVWELEGLITTSGFTAAVTHTMFTFDTGYRVAVEREFEAGGAQSAHYAVRLGFMPNGTLTGSVPTAAAGSTSIVWLSGVTIRNPR